MSLCKSVSWQIQELLEEFALQITSHIGRLLSFVQKTCWRTNPNVLLGAKVTVFRRGPGRGAAESERVIGYVTIVVALLHIIHLISRATHQ
jgi:hypothetical protein